MSGEDPEDPAVGASTVTDGGGEESAVTFKSGEVVSAAIAEFTIQNGTGTGETWETGLSTKVVVASNFTSSTLATVRESISMNRPVPGISLALPGPGETVPPSGVNTGGIYTYQDNTFSGNTPWADRQAKDATCTLSNPTPAPYRDRGLTPLYLFRHDLQN